MVLKMYLKHFCNLVVTYRTLSDSVNKHRTERNYKAAFHETWLLQTCTQT